MCAHLHFYEDMRAFIVKYICIQNCAVYFYRCIHLRNICEREAHVPINTSVYVTWVSPVLHDMYNVDSVCGRVGWILFLFIVSITSCLVIFISPSSKAGD
jgi:hypothetical protein